MKPKITPHEHLVTHYRRSYIKGHLPAALWFTGLSGSGKSSIANEVEFRLNTDYHAHTYLLDGDNIRTGLNRGLGFSAEDRVENIRRIGEVVKLFYDAGLIVLTAFISPFAADRELVRQLFPSGGFIEVFVRCPLAVCEQRDPKKLYQKARLGEIADFTGISSPYEAPENPELILDSDQLSISDCAELVIRHLIERGIIKEYS